NAVGFVGAQFDGRYVYFAPHFNGTTTTGETVRYDTQGSGFTNGASWQAFDTSTLNAQAVGYQHAGFDGQYIYYCPSNYYNGAVPPGSLPDGPIVRFSAKSPAWLPLNWHAAFD